MQNGEWKPGGPDPAGHLRLHPANAATIKMSVLQQDRVRN